MSLGCRGAAPRRLLNAARLHRFDSTSFGTSIAATNPPPKHRVDAMTYRPSYGEFPQAAVFLFGLGLGGFFDGIVFHQVLQWHHMVSTWYPPTSLENLRINTR